MVELIRAVGVLGLFAIIFAESGLFFGFFLPGDSLLFTAGFLASPAAAELRFNLNFPVLLIGCFIAAVLGDNVGYTFGRRAGRKLFDREENFFFHKKNIERAEKFYAEHGGKTVVIARFIPVVRTFAPIVAGMGEMKYRTFFFFNLMGALLWVGSMLVGGYFFGQILINTFHINPDEIDKILLPVVFAIIIISVAPAAYHVLKEPETRAALKQQIAKTLRRGGTPADAPVAPAEAEPEAGNR